jgi:cell division protein FtsB
MGIITEMLKGIPLNSVLRERIVQMESQMAILKEENAALKNQNAELKTENIKLKQQINKLSHDQPPVVGNIIDTTDPALDKIKPRLTSG